MARFRHPFSSTASFRSRLLTIVSLGILALALTASIATAWLTSRQATNQMVAQGIKVTESLAEQGVLALLYESSENAREPLHSILSFPDIVQTALFDLRYQPLLVQDKLVSTHLPTFTPVDTHQSALVHEDADHWFFSAPVITGPAPGQTSYEEELFALSNSEPEKIGYAVVTMHKGSLKKMRVNIFINNIVIGLSFALVLLFFINFGIKRLTHPLYQLADLMEVAEQEKSHVFANLKGPKEINYMAGTFNRMMASLQDRDKRLRQHRKLLQSEVELRTKELVLARDAALSASRHKSEFLANMSHELRTPLQAIIGYSDLVKEELELEGMDENAEELERVIGNAQRLLSLINQILDLAKIEAGKMELHLQDITLAELIAEISTIINPLVRQNNNQLQTEIHDTLGPLRIDKEKLLQMLLNLLSNACKFTKNGTIELIAQREKHLLTLQVIDSGIGLTAEQQTIIFEEFRQVDGSTTRHFEGTGLGLAISRRFAQLMGGNITVESVPQAGSTFSIRLPLPILETTATQEPELTRPLATPTPKLHPQTDKPYRILLVDDDSSFLDLQLRSLEEAGYQCFTAINGDEALQRARVLQPDIITLDIMMPTMDGWEVLTRMRQDPELATIPIIICSIVDEKEHGFQLGANEYVTKPIQRAKLLMTIDKICKGL